MATKKNDTAIELRPLDIRRVPLTIVGDTPLIVHAWSEKAKRMMLEAQMGLSKGKKKEYKDPVEDFINSMYWLSGKPEEYTEEAFGKAVADGARFGFPATAVKAAAVSAAYRQGWSQNKVVLQGEMFIESDADGMIEIKTDVPPVMREDMVKVGKGTADLRYRGEFRNWRADIILRYNANGQFSLENIVNIINAGGFFCGIGEWRPEKGGTNGMYHVE